jgi:xanthine dehydrogenase accessory factor
MQDLFKKILGTLQQGQPCVMATIVASSGSAPRKVGARMLVFGDASIAGTIGGGALEKLVIADAMAARKRHQSFLKVYPLDKRSGLGVCGGKVSLFIECLEPSRRLVICGAGHIGLALSFVAKMLGFNVAVVDHRRAFANAGRFPHADRIFCASYASALKKAAIDADTSIVIVTHGHVFDEASLAAALKTRAGYIGMIGSRKKIRFIFDRLRKKGFKPSALQSVYTPVGLDIGAQTPEEIAIAIAAQIIQVVKARASRAQRRL